MKRYIEIRDAAEEWKLVRGRGYMRADSDLVMATGVSSGMVAILVLALFAHEPEAMAHYAAPELLLLICLPLIYWLNRMWIMARRGEVDVDPVAFAVRDRRSIAIGLVIAGVFLVTQIGPERILAGKSSPPDAEIAATGA